MLPVRTLHYGSEVWGADFSCLGFQVADVVARVGEYRHDLQWYVSDAGFVGEPLARAIASTPTPVVVGDTHALVRFASRVVQFSSGVFAGVPAHVTNPYFREGELWTEDEDYADLAESFVEIRAFDAAYISIASADEQLLDMLDALFLK